MQARTEKEKHTLRLMVRGNDAKSIARSQGLSVHTISERLRDARRKMAVSSGREAARLLLAAEGGDALSAHPDSIGDMAIGGDAGHPQRDREVASIGGVGQAYRLPRIIIGGFLMTLVLGLLAFAALPQLATTSPAPSAAAGEAPISEAVDTARRWLALRDPARWTGGYRATGTSFRTPNTVQVWTAASQRVRARPGEMLSRTFLAQENRPAPPAGYEVLKFRTRFASKADALETVMLDREDGAWRVVGVTIG